MENQHPNGKKAMEEELLRGRDMANQLLEVLAYKSNNSGEEEGSKSSVLTFAEDLVRKVLRSFTNTLLLLKNNHVSNEVVVPITVKDVSSSKKRRNMETVDETCKSRDILNTRNRRRCYKRKAITPTWEKDSSILVEDGHAWRKYGQKMTLNAKYIWSYYRCTHKDDQGCQAIKQVQRIQDDPPLYRTTYYGHHTCKSSLYPEIILDPAVSPSGSSILLSFNSSLQSKQEHSFSSSLPVSTKNEPMEVIHNDHIAQTQLSSSGDLLLYDYEIYWRHVSMLSSTESVEVNNVFEQLGF